MSRRGRHEDLLPDSRVHMWHAPIPKPMQRRRTFWEWLVHLFRGEA